MKVNVTLHTDGRGFWSSKQKEIKVIEIELLSKHVYKNGFFGELAVYFEGWNVSTDGLIYTDPLFLKELKDSFKKLGFSDSALERIEYSEQGMQGDDYVSLDVWDNFIVEFGNLTS